MGVEPWNLEKKGLSNQERDRIKKVYPLTVEGTDGSNPP